MQKITSSSHVAFANHKLLRFLFIQVQDSYQIKSSLFMLKFQVIVVIGNSNSSYMVYVFCNKDLSLKKKRIA